MYCTFKCLRDEILKLFLVFFVDRGRYVHEHLLFKLQEVVLADLWTVKVPGRSIKNTFNVPEIF